MPGIRRSPAMLHTPGDAGFLAADDREDLFSLTGFVIRNLVEMAEDLNEEVTCQAITGSGRDNLWSKTMREISVSQEDSLQEKDPRITAVCTSNIYAEADRAAAYILQLVREHGYRFGDIVVVCNDTGLRSGVIRRTFVALGDPGVHRSEAKSDPASGGRIFAVAFGNHRKWLQR